MAKIKKLKMSRDKAKKSTDSAVYLEVRKKEKERHKKSDRVIDVLNIMGFIVLLVIVTGAIKMC